MSVGVGVGTGVGAGGVGDDIHVGVSLGIDDDDDTIIEIIEGGGDVRSGGVGGDGVSLPPDPEHAIGWFSIAAERFPFLFPSPLSLLLFTNAGFQSIRGVNYAFWRGGRALLCEDCYHPEEALRWTQEGALRGCVFASFNLGLQYFEVRKVFFFF